MKVGRIVVVGRPNAGKSTLINALVGQKISIVTPTPQTTRKTVQGVYWDERGQVIISDTPGAFLKQHGPITPPSVESLDQHDLIIYLIDKTRARGEEENRILGLVRQSKKPKIIVINKTDVKKLDYIYQYKFLEDEFDAWLEISAKQSQHLETLKETVFQFLPEGKPLFDPETLRAFPALNVTPEEFIAELIREKAFLVLRQEIPYEVSVECEEITEKEKVFVIKATIYTTDEHYRPIIIGKGGQTIKKIGIMAREEIELITDKKAFLDLSVKIRKK